VYDDNAHCFVCNYHFIGEYEITEETNQKRAKSTDLPLTPVARDFRAIPDRKLSSDTVEKYKVLVNQNPKSPIQHVYPYFDGDGKHVANKVRVVRESEDESGNPVLEKDFYAEGPIGEATLFGQQLFPAGCAKAITITEGELDAMAAYEMQGSKWPCVSVRGASSAKKDCLAVFEYLSSFEKIVVCFDNDEPGQKAAKQVIQLFKPGQAYNMRPRRYKDASDYNKNGESRAFVKEWWDAEPYKPDGIKLGRDMWGEIINHKDPKSVPYPFAGLNKATYGLRTSELVIITAPTGIGKTSVLKEIEYSLLMNEELKKEDAGVGFLHFEEPNYDTAIGLMSIHNNKPYHLPDTVRTSDELRSAYESVLDNDRVVIWDHFGSNSIDAVLAKVRHMAALGCKYIVVDHLSIIVSDQSGDERKQLDEIATKLKTLTMELDISVICVIHQNRNGQIRGTAGVEQLANMVISLERDMTDINEWRRNVTKFVIQKNRFCGRAGPVCWVHYDDCTGRLKELTKEEIDRYERGEDNTGAEMPF